MLLFVSCYSCDREVPQSSKGTSYGSRFYRLVLLGMVFLWGAIGSLSAQGRAISGTVSDSQGLPMPGVNITVKESPGVGVITDIDGKYQITAPSDNSVLVYSFIGFQVEEIPVSGRSVIVRPVSNALEALQGRAAGVDITLVIHLCML